MYVLTYVHCTHVKNNLVYQVSLVENEVSFLKKDQEEECQKYLEGTNVSNFGPVCF